MEKVEVMFQEWTEEFLDGEGIDGEEARKRICKLHNAALATLREQLELSEANCRELHKDKQQILDQLDAADLEISKLRKR